MNADDYIYLYVYNTHIYIYICVKWNKHRQIRTGECVLNFLRHSLNNEIAYKQWHNYQFT